MLLAQAETAGSATIVTAAGGVVISLVTVYLNSRKQGEARKEGDAKLSVEVEQLRKEVEVLRKQLQESENVRIERDKLMELCNAYGGRRLRKRLIDIDLRRQ